MTASPAHEPSRCARRFSNGKRCRLFPRPDSAFCARHAAIGEASDLAATLTAGLDQFTSAEPINRFLSRLLLLLAQDRISPRRAAVMAYTANLLLRSVSAMGQEAAAAQNPPKRQVQVIWNLPCPPREREGMPEPSPAMSE
jgi:hypothetical protein